uniref:Uncharacterized protein MANES_18G144200 n=1 Tax=Rhizophora mucronata TaxID=61149 RepID=A0A2P2KB53_RHIMU
MSMTLAPFVKSDCLRVMPSAKTFPLKMSFWPRGRTLVRGCKRVFRSLTVESIDAVIGIDLPLNFTVMLIDSELFASIFCFSVLLRSLIRVLTLTIAI